MTMTSRWELFGVFFRPTIRILKAQQGDGTIYDLNARNPY
jgi:hypothetical protein